MANLIGKIRSLRSTIQYDNVRVLSKNDDGSYRVELLDHEDKPRDIFVEYIREDDLHPAIGRYRVRGDKPLSLIEHPSEEEIRYGTWYVWDSYNDHVVAYITSGASRYIANTMAEMMNRNEFKV